ncbi:unnamed protein product [Dracunculus medinensis]|uniref:ANF_receptor domain-containing protein n=1 Tax=Dracunculus medinensis TaxID=318479 RepID=A0A0N4UCW5_DRAME|nr:unnamed protein product [Dracunculus medinensis]
MIMVKSLSLSAYQLICIHFWADNGDECSKQYAGTGALKADYTRMGKRTYVGTMQDGINAMMRYFRNNFADGYRQDAIDLFLGNYRIDPDNLPLNFETAIISFDYHGGAIIGAIFAATMTILCVLVAGNNLLLYSTMNPFFLPESIINEL